MNTMKQFEHNKINIQINHLSIGLSEIENELDQQKLIAGIFKIFYSQNSSFKRLLF